MSAAAAGLGAPFPPFAPFSGSGFSASAGGPAVSPRISASCEAFRARTSAVRMPSSSAIDLVEIGSHCMFANGCFITDGNHRFDDPDKPVPWQGFTSKGPTRVGDNVWCGANVVITSGVTVGERSVLGANSVITTDIPPFSIAAGAPAKVLRRVEYDERPSPP